MTYAGRNSTTGKRQTSHQQQTMDKNRILLLLTLFAVSCTPKQQTGNIPNVEIEQAAAYSSQQHVFPGITQSEHSSELSFMTAGKVTSIEVSEGEKVKKGQVIARLDDRDYRVQFDATQAEYQQIRNECERVMELYKDNVVSANDYDKARYGLEQITAKLNHHRDQLNDCVIYAPYDGYIDNIFVNEKEAVIPGLPVVSLFSGKGIEMSINVPLSEYLRRSSLGRCTATANGNKGRTYEVVLKTAAQKAGTAGLYNMVFKMKQNQDSNDLTPGMTMMLSLNYQDEGNSAVIVPANCILNDREQAFVFRYDEESQTVSKQPVTVQMILADGSAVLSEGVSVSDKVVTAGMYSITDNQKVRILPAPSELNQGNLK